MQRQSTNAIAALAAIVIVAQACATTGSRTPSGDPRSYKGPPTTAAITAGDLRTRLYIFADDSMNGRAAGTLDNLRGAAYIEREVRRLGLEPAGENGTYFQDIAFATRTVSPASAISVDGRAFALGKDFIPRDFGAGMRNFDGADVVYGGVWGDAASLIDAQAVAGKVVVLTAPGATVNRFSVNNRFRTAAAVVVATLDRIPPETRSGLLAPSMELAAAGTTNPAAVPTFMYASDALVNAVFGGVAPSTLKAGAAGKPVRGQISYQAGTRPPGRNVIAVLRGSDPKLRGQYVAFGAHNDHDPPLSAPVDHDSLRAFNTVARPGGAESSNTTVTEAQWVRIRAIRDSLRAIRPPRPDSILNGADDDGSGSMALLEIAEAFAKSTPKPKRSLLFVWHTAEELGLLGADWFTKHPTVARDSIVTQLNIDMIGRGGSADAVHDQNGQLSYGSPDFVEVVGSRKLSTELGDIVDAANQAQPKPLAFSRVYDAPGEPHQMYCRSDHYMYARFGIPITFFFTSVHRDYHQITDEPQYIDYAKYARIVNVIHEIGKRVGNLDHRPLVDKPKPDPTADCVA